MMGLTVRNPKADRANAGGGKIGKALVAAFFTEVMITPLLLLSVAVDEEDADLGVVAARQTVSLGNSLRELS